MQQVRFILTSLFFILSLTCQVYAEELSIEDDIGDTGGMVIVETPEVFDAPYIERRGAHGWLLGLHSENYYPFNYQSQLGTQNGNGDTAFIEDFIGLDAVKLLGLEFGYKMNISLGSLSILANYSMANVSGDLDTSLGFTRIGLSANATLDGIFKEPYVAPYGQVGVSVMTIEESTSTDSTSGSTSPTLYYKYGLMFQLDWIEAKLDPTAKIERLTSSGLQNTYIDVYYVDHLPSSNAIDPATASTEGEINTASSGEIGLGLKLEF